MRAPRQADLDALFVRARQVRVLEGGVRDATPLGHQARAVLAGTEVRALGRALAVQEGGAPFHCMCLGDWALELLDGAGARVTTIGLHHGQSIRVPGWSSDAWLATPDAVLDLLAAAGVDAPRDQARAARTEASAHAAWRGRWDAAMPRALAPHVGALISPLGSPHVRSHPSWAAAVAALVAAEGDERAAARALLGWLATSTSGWGQHPAAENVPLTLLDVLGPEVIVAAIADLDGPVVVAAARALAMATGSRRRLREAAAPVATRLTAAIADRDPDDRARLAAVLRPPPSRVDGHDELVRVGTIEHPGSLGLAVHHGAVFAGDGAEILGFGAGGERHVLATTGGGHAELAADDDHVLVTDMTGERVLLIARATGAVTVLAEREGRPMYPGLAAGRAVWLSCPYQNVPGRLASVPWVHVRTWTPAEGVRTLASWADRAAWDAVVTDDGVALVERTREEGLLRTRAVVHLRRIGWDGRVDDLAVLADPALDDAHVRLAFAYEDFFWIGRARQELWTCTADGRRVRRAARLPGEPVALCADPRGAVVAVRAGEGTYALIDCPHATGGGELVRYQAPAWHRPQLAASAYGVFFAVDGEVIGAPRAISRG